MKKQICVITAAMMAATALTGCPGRTKETAAAPIAAKTAAETTQAPATSEKTEVESLAREAMTAQVGESVEILVTTVTSLENVYEDELIPMFQEQYPGMVVKSTYDSPGKLQMQIEEGLEMDVFMSAATKQMTAPDEEGMIEPDAVTNLLEDKIVLIVPAGSGAGFERPEDTKKVESIVLEDPASMPAEQYAQETLIGLNIRDKIQNKVSFGTGATEVLNRVATSSVDADIVYATDVVGMVDQVQMVAEAPEGSLGGKVIYSVAIVKNAAHVEEVRSFVEFPETDEAMKILEEYGFTKGE